MQTSFTEQQEILAALCLLGDGEKGKNLFQFASTTNEKQLGQIAQEIIKEEKVERKEVIARIQGLTRTRKFSPLDELHPAWIVERFEKESPLVLGLLCRLLPGEKARYFISHLPEKTRRKLPMMGQTYQVPERVVETVRALVEKQWSFEMPLSPRAEFSFSHILWMKIEDVRLLFWELGMNEIRKAFYHADPRVFRAFLSRFPTKEASEIRERIDQGNVVSPEEKQSAQKHLLSLQLEYLSAPDLIREIGYSVFARSISDHDTWFALLIQKLNPEEGYRLRRMAQESLTPLTPEKTERQKEVVHHIHQLALKGLIRRYWKEESMVGIKKS